MRMYVANAQHFYVHMVPSAVAGVGVVLMVSHRPSSHHAANVGRHVRDQILGPKTHVRVVVHVVLRVDRLQVRPVLDLLS